MMPREGDLVFLKGRTSDHMSRTLFAQFGTIGCWKHHCTIRRLRDVCPELRPEFDLQEALNQPLPIRPLDESHLADRIAL
jgi:hypothetical protein